MKRKFFKSISFYYYIRCGYSIISILEAIINCKPVISVPNPIFKELYPESICAIYSKEPNCTSLAEEIISFKEENYLIKNHQNIF